MESEDDMHDANDVESLEDFYSGDTAIDSDDVADGDYEFIDNDSDDDYDDFSYQRNQQSYTILSEADIRQCQEDDIAKISMVLSIAKVEAEILLRHYNWSVSKVHDEWFADEEKVRKTVGLLERPIVEFPNTREMTCGICFETFPSSMMNAAACGHPFCNSCWAGYMGTAINDGPGCLNLQCPDPSCGAAVNQEMINMIVSEEDKEKYARYFLRSYIEDNRKVKFINIGCYFANHREILISCIPRLHPQEKKKLVFFSFVDIDHC